MTDTTRTILSPLAAHFKRRADFFEQEALNLALALDQEMNKPVMSGPTPFVAAPVTIPEGTE